MDKTTDEKEKKKVCIVRTSTLHTIKCSVEKSVKCYDKGQNMWAGIKSNRLDLSPAQRQLHLWQKALVKQWLHKQWLYNKSWDDAEQRIALAQDPSEMTTYPIGKKKAMTLP